MIILGINAYHGDVSAVLVRDAELVAAVEEERFRRVKHWAGFPREAIRTCLEMAGVTPSEVDHFAISRNPRARSSRASGARCARSRTQYPTLAAGLACRRARVPCLVTPHGMLDSWALRQKAWRKRLYLRLAEGATLRGAAAIQMTSEGEWRDSRPERWNPSVFVLPWGVGREAWANLPEPADFAERLPALRGRRLVLFLGRLHPKKQPDVVLRAFHRVCAGDPETRLVLAGRGPAKYLAALGRLARELGIAERVVFPGLLRGRAVQEAYRAAALFVLPSWQENFGYAVVEAMAAGCPVVVSDRVDLAPDVEKAGAGLVAPPTLEGTAGAMARLLADEWLRAEMSERGRALVLERFTWERVVGELLGICEDVLTSRRLSPAWRVEGGSAEIRVARG